MGVESVKGREGRRSGRGGRGKDRYKEVGMEG